jgi:hypothetical protein
MEQDPACMTTALEAPAFSTRALLRGPITSIPLSSGGAANAAICDVATQLTTAWASSFGSNRAGALGHRHISLREIPSFFIMAFKVVRGTPRRVAVVLTTPPVSRKTRRM